MSLPLPSCAVDEALARLAAVRAKIEALEAEVWCLEREQDELRTLIRGANTKPEGVAA